MHRQGRFTVLNKITMPRTSFHNLDASWSAVNGSQKMDFVGSDTDLEYAAETDGAAVRHSLYCIS